MHRNRFNYFASPIYRSRMMVAQHFNEKKAISPQSAIEMSPLDWESLGIIYNPQTYKFIKKTDSGKYWIDPEELKKSQLKFSNYLKIFKCVFAALLVFIIIMFIIVIGSMIGIWSVGGIFSRNIFI